MEKISIPVLKIHPTDNVLVALQPLPKGTIVEGIVLQDDISVKHKFAITDLPIGSEVKMYGVLVGKTTAFIPKGGLLTIQNVEHAAAQFDATQQKLTWSPPNVEKWLGTTFNGYHRKDGSVGTANYWLVIPLVFCENRNIEVMKATMLPELGYAQPASFKVDVQQLIRQYQAGASEQHLLETNILQTAQQINQHRLFPNVDGIKFLTHTGGCGGTRQDSEMLCRLFAGYLNNPNVAGATVLSLGCQNAQIQVFEDAIAAIAPNFSKPLYILEQQKSHSERSYISDAVKQTFVGLTKANEIVRQPASLHHLCLGLECGGSDGFSGISANPALGYASDLLVALGGRAILSEFPELNGVEQSLINRCQYEADAQKFTALMKTYAKRAIEVGSGFAYNPSPGNIKDGLITDAMKSAGAARKGGTSPIVQVLDYTEQATLPGLSLLCTPGNDVESTTGLAGSGANLIVFTTGLGTPTGNPIAPTIKFSSNTALAERMPDLIDLDAGTIITGEDTIESKGEALLDYLIEVASGTTVPHAVRLGQDDFIPWKRGISL